MTFDDDNEDADDLQIDLYGISGRFTPGSGQKEDPQSWRQVLGFINSNLMIVVERTIGGGLLSDATRAVSNVLRSLGGVRTALSRCADVVAIAHDEADRREHKARRKTSQANAAAVQEALDRIEGVLLRHRAKGGYAEIRIEPGSTVRLLLLPSEEHIRVVESMMQKRDDSIAFAAEETIYSGKLLRATGCELVVTLRDAGELRIGQVATFPDTGETAHVSEIELQEGQAHVTLTFA